MPGDTDADGGTIDGVINKAMDQNFAAVHAAGLRLYQDGEQMARKAYARLEDNMDFLTQQAQSTFLQVLTSLGLAPQILDQRSVEAQPQQNNSPGWAGGPAPQLPPKVSGGTTTG
jgi:hypothetical protein